VEPERTAWVVPSIETTTPPMGAPVAELITRPVKTTSAESRGPASAAWKAIVMKRMRSVAAEKMRSIGVSPEKVDCPPGGERAAASTAALCLDDVEPALTCTPAAGDPRMCKTGRSVRRTCIEPDKLRIRVLDSRIGMP
jgi:hypothetical protein